MPRKARSSADGVVFHVLNRGNCRMTIFRKPGDHAAFVKILEQGRRRAGMRILGYCLMRNHWHLELEPWPVGKPSDWTAMVNESIDKAELAKVRMAVDRGQPFGGDSWTGRIARRLGLEPTLRNPWRPRKSPAKAKGKAAASA